MNYVEGNRGIEINNHNDLLRERMYGRLRIAPEAWSYLEANMHRIQAGAYWGDVLGEWQPVVRIVQMNPVQDVAFALLGMRQAPAEDLGLNDAEAIARLIDELPEAPPEDPDAPDAPLPDYEEPQAAAAAAAAEVGAPNRIESRLEYQSQAHVHYFLEQAMLSTLGINLSTDQDASNYTKFAIQDLYKLRMAHFPPRFLGELENHLFDYLQNPTDSEMDRVVDTLEEILLRVNPRFADYPDLTRGLAKRILPTLVEIDSPEEIAECRERYQQKYNHPAPEA